MGRKRAFHFRAITDALLSASLILCLIMAPLCTTRCAAQACASASSADPTGACHHSSNRTGTLEFSVVTPADLCTAGEIVFTAPRLEERAISQKSSVATNFYSPLAFHLAGFLGTIHADGVSALSSGASPGSTIAVPPSIPLRI